MVTFLVQLLLAKEPAQRPGGAARGTMTYAAEVSLKESLST